MEDLATKLAASIPVAVLQVTVVNVVRQVGNCASRIHDIKTLFFFRCEMNLELTLTQELLILS